MHAQRLLDILVVTASSRVDIVLSLSLSLSLSLCEGQTVGGIEHLLWDTSVKVYGADLPTILGDLLNAYSRSPGMDSVARLTSSCIGTQGYEALLISQGMHPKRRPRFRSWMAHRAAFAITRVPVSGVAAATGGGESGSRIADRRLARIRPWDVGSPCITGAF